MMKRLVGLILLLATLWSGYWLVGYWGLTKGVEMWFDDRRAEGWVAEFDTRSTLGFPNRFDTTFTNLTLADPGTSVAWNASFFQLLALSYRPTHVIAVWPHDQRVSTPTETLTLTTSDMRASLVMRPDAVLTLERTNLAIKDLTLVSSQDWQMSASALNLAMHAQPETDATYRIALQTQNLAPPAAYRLPSGTDLPRSFSALQADITVAFDRAWDRTAIEDSRPQPVRINIALAEAKWGDLELNATGSVSMDSLGYPTGTITIRAVNWREILGVARASEQVSPAILDVVESALEVISQLAGNSNRLDIPLNFKNGMTRLGPVPIAPAPIIRLK